ncbi:hypothetical protein C2S51_002385 [Perilla frutescens var. frutescens]|nr:hypothetical protein C2S51_002385 [Perilla frutescens var. frutescens]
MRPSYGNSVETILQLDSHIILLSQGGGCSSNREISCVLSVATAYIRTSILVVEI